MNHTLWRITVWTSLLPFLIAITAGKVHAQDVPRKMELKRGFLSGAKFTLNAENPRKIHNFSGLSYRDEFVEVMSEHPAALKRAKRALPWNGVALVGSLGILAVSIKILAETISDAQKVSDGELVDDSANWGDVIAIGAAGVIMLTGALVSSSHLKNSIKIFNKLEKGGTEDSGTEPGRIGSSPATPHGAFSNPRIAIALRGTPASIIGESEKGWGTFVSWDLHF